GYLRLFFFFSSRRRHTRFSRDWSSDVCSSDLRSGVASRSAPVLLGGFTLPATHAELLALFPPEGLDRGPRRPRPGPRRGLGRRRSEERRVGKAGRGRTSRADEREKGDGWTQRP